MGHLGDGNAFVEEVVTQNAELMWRTELCLNIWKALNMANAEVKGRLQPNCTGPPQSVQIEPHFHVLFLSFFADRSRNWLRFEKEASEGRGSNILLSVNWLCVCVLFVIRWLFASIRHEHLSGSCCQGDTTRQKEEKTFTYFKVHTFFFFVQIFFKNNTFEYFCERVFEFSAGLMSRRKWHLFHT